jgi:hypothetical protein
MQNKDLCSRLLQVRLVGIKFSGATDLGQTDSSTFILRVCNINGDRYVVSNDVPYCRLRIWDWAKSRNLRVYSLNDKKMLNVIPLHVVQQNRDKVYQSLRRLSEGCVFTFDRALQAAGIEGIPSRYNHTVSEDQWRDSRQAQRAWDKVFHPHSDVCKPAVSVARPGLIRRILRFVGL